MFYTDISSENHKGRLRCAFILKLSFRLVWRVQVSWRISAETKPKLHQNCRFISFSAVTSRNVTFMENDRLVGGLCPCLSPFTIKSPPLPVCETSLCSLNNLISPAALIMAALTRILTFLCKWLSHHYMLIWCRHWIQGCFQDVQGAVCRNPRTVEMKPDVEDYWFITYNLFWLCSRFSWVMWFVLKISKPKLEWEKISCRFDTCDPSCGQNQNHWNQKWSSAVQHQCVSVFMCAPAGTQVAFSL